MSQTISTTLTLFRADTEWTVTVSATVYSPEPDTGLFEPQIEDIIVEEATAEGKDGEAQALLILSDHEYSLTYEALLEAAEQ